MNIIFHQESSFLELVCTFKWVCYFLYKMCHAGAIRIELVCHSCHTKTI